MQEYEMSCMEQFLAAILVYLSRNSIENYGKIDQRLVLTINNVQFDIKKNS